MPDSLVAQIAPLSSPSISLNSNDLYKTVPLPDPKTHIRLLHIYEVFSTVHYELESFLLEGSRTFCALSYTWGDTTQVKDITVNDQSIKITKSLFDALLYVKQHWIRAVRETATESLWLWADALCIDQTDQAEKAHQIPLMRTIYSSAKATFCSLSPVSDESKLPTILESLSVIAKRLEVRELSDNFHSYKFAEEVFEELPSEFIHGGAFMDHFQLLELPYWRRAWVFQELLVSRRLLAFYAESEFDLDSFEKIERWASQIRMLSFTDPLPQKISAVISSLGSAWILSRVRLYRKSVTTKPTHTLTPEETKTLQVSFLLMGSQLRALEAKDYVYALLGITGFDIQPRYDEAVSVADVYVEFCTKYTDLAKSLPVMPPLGYLNMAGLANGNPQGPVLPTWVPNFPGRRNHDREYAIYGLDHHERERGGFDKYPWHDETLRRLEDVNIQGSSLLTTSIVIDSLAEVSPVLDATLLRDQGPFAEPYQSWLTGVFGMMQHIFESTNRSFSPDEHPLTKLCGAFFHESVDWQSPKVVRGADLLRDLFVYTTEISSLMLLFKFTPQICLKQPRHDEIGETASALRKLHDEIILVPSLGQYQDRQQRTLYDIARLAKDGIRVGRTVSNNFAIVPREAQAEDHIALFTGYNDLSLIRQVDGHHVYVGPVGFEREIADRKIEEIRAIGEKLQQIELR